MCPLDFHEICKAISFMGRAANSLLIPQLHGMVRVIKSTAIAHEARKGGYWVTVARRTAQSGV
ncbi:hypothetical protein [Allorhizobium undicola]|uniref:hypothetical protein n=1 Tax=Allorhizobium undicola TaxID=78527 RepID=UPI0012B5ACB2|nr:hypothetical protein [Allorhizobium undicola]